MLLRRLALGLAVVATVAAAGCSADNDGGPTGKSSSGGPAPQVARGAPDAESGPAPAATDLTWTTLPKLPGRESAQAASSAYVVSRTADKRSVVVRNGTATEELGRYQAPAGFEVSTVVLAPPLLVMASADPVNISDERMSLIDLTTGVVRHLGAGTPSLWEGLWSIGHGRLTYGAHGEHGSFCIAEADLGDLRGTSVDCVPRGQGMHQVKQSPWGYGYVQFENTDEGSCGTARVRRGEDAPVGLDDPGRCRVWEAMPLEGDGAIWSEVPDPEQIEVAELFVREDGGEPQSLGYETTGSLTWCGESLWFLRQMESTLMRWTPGKGLETVFRIDTQVDPDKVSVLSAPTCAGDAISLSELIAAPGRANEEILHVARVQVGPRPS